MPELKGKVAIVTGAGRLRGIGRASAVRLAQLGAHVVVTGTGRTSSQLPTEEQELGWRDIESTCEQIKSLGSKALPLVVDVTQASQVNQMVDNVLDEFGRIDILVNNAAYARGPDRVPIHKLDDSIFQKVMDIKVTGTYLCTKAVLKSMLDNGEGGKIVNVSSVAGKMGSPNTLAYNAANFAVVGMTQSMAKELGPHHINVNAVCPGTVDTHRMDVIGRGGDWERLIQSTPIGRAGTDDEVGGLIAFLCTEPASWIQGQSINIDGGRVMEH